MIIGWIGVGLLVVAYLILLTPFFKQFLLIDAIASTILTIHALLINDIPFTIVNGFIALLLFYKYIREVKKNE